MSVPNTSADGSNVPALTEAELVELSDLRRRTFRDSSRRTWLDLQPGDRFSHLGERFGVLWVGPIELFEGYYLRQLAVMPVAGGAYRLEWATEHRLLIDGATAATPEEAARARAAWSGMSSGLRAELERMRVEVAG